MMEREYEEALYEKLVSMKLSAGLIEVIENKIKKDSKNVMIHANLLDSLEHLNKSIDYLSKALNSQEEEDL